MTPDLWCEVQKVLLYVVWVEALAGCSRERKVGREAAVAPEGCRFAHTAVRATQTSPPHSPSLTGIRSLVCVWVLRDYLSLYLNTVSWTLYIVCLIFTVWKAVMLSREKMQSSKLILIFRKVSDFKYKPWAGAFLYYQCQFAGDRAARTWTWLCALDVL